LDLAQNCEIIRNLKEKVYVSRGERKDEREGGDKKEGMKKEMKGREKFSTSWLIGLNKEQKTFVFYCLV
jgi:hypothetical protein